MHHDAFTQFMRNITNQLCPLLPPNLKPTHWPRYGGTKYVAPQDNSYVLRCGDYWYSTRPWNVQKMALSVVLPIQSTPNRGKIRAELYYSETYIIKNWPGKLVGLQNIFSQFAGNNRFFSSSYRNDPRNYKFLGKWESATQLDLAQTNNNFNLTLCQPEINSVVKDLNWLITNVVPAINALP